MPLTPKSPSFGRQWALPIVVLTSAALFIFWGLYSIDHYMAALGPNVPRGSAIARYTRFDPGSLTDALSGLASVLAAVFGIVVTVVSIIVQLSSDRYTHVAKMFMRDRVNLVVMGFYVMSCVTAIWLSLALQHDFAPRVMLISQLVLTTGGLVLMAPYFGYVFWFLDPTNIVARLRHEALRIVTRGAAATRLDDAFAAQVATVTALEELTDITSNSISGKDKIVASAAVDALRDFALEYLRHKPSAVGHWFTIGEELRLNPDFVALDPESLGDLETRRTWVEWSVMRQYLGIYNDALATMQDINYLIAIDTRYIGEAAAEAKDDELVALVFRFMNSYLRSALNVRDVRTVYNVLNQYRLLVQAMLRTGNSATALQGVKHMIYYGHVGFDMQLDFVTETVAYDISALCQYANEVKSDVEDDILSILLHLDQPKRAHHEDRAFFGVRKAQVKLAAYYLVEGEEERARVISRDLAHEDAGRLTTIRDSLQSVTSKDFWEIIDRGRNFEYMPETHRQALDTFFSWLNLPAHGA